MNKRITIVALAVLMLLIVALPASAEKVEIKGEAFDTAIAHLPAGTIVWTGAQFEDSFFAGVAVAANPVTGRWEYQADPDGAGPLLINGPVGTGWTAYNFAPFWYDLDTGATSEQLRIFPTLDVTNGALAGNQREIDENEVIYETRDLFIEYELSEAIPAGTTAGDNTGGDAGAITDAIVLADNDADGFAEVGYSKIGWLGEEYVAIDGDASKLAKLLIEQGGATAEKKTLGMGETWNIGDWELTVNAIDAKATPRQAWFTLSYKGTKVDDAVATSLGAGRVYTYVESNIAGETNVPMFVTYIDNIFAGATTDMVQFRFTWAISKDVTTVKTGDDFGVFEVRTANDVLINMDNDNSITLSADSVVALGGNMKFKIADDDANLRFFPIVEKTGVGVPGVTTPGVTTPGKTPVGNESVEKPPVEETTPAAAVTTAAAEAAKKTEPGFEAIFAIAGLLAVAFLVLRQRK